MSMQAEPKTVLRFLLQYFDQLEKMMEAQRSEGFIRSETLTEICKEADIRAQLSEYKVLQVVKSDFEFKKIYYDFLSHIIGEQRLVLPESVEKYHDSITKLFYHIQYTLPEEKEILTERIAELQSEIKNLLDMVENNTNTLLKETRELKANVEKIDYLEKVKKASFWIDYYIIPLNQLLDINNHNSVSSKLYEVSYFVNTKRLQVEDEDIRLKFEKLYENLLHVNDDLLRNSKILTHELMPLIERIKTESLILTGFIQYLKKPYKIKTPLLLKDKRTYTYNKNTYLNTLEYFEQFMSQEPVLYEEQANTGAKWVFNFEKYKTNMRKKLPMENFFEWASKELDYEFSQIESEKFFSLCSLLFEDDLEILVDETARRQRIYTSEQTFLVPKLTVKKDEQQQLPKGA
ncbi:MAG: hypothetical protein ACHQF2_01495 [Flavobacteriales bacterium]